MWHAWGVHARTLGEIDMASYVANVTTRRSLGGVSWQYDQIAGSYAAAILAASCIFRVRPVRHSGEALRNNRIARARWYDGPVTFLLLVVALQTTMPAFPWNSIGRCSRRRSSG